MSPFFTRDERSLCSENHLVTTSATKDVVRMCQTRLGVMTATWLTRIKHFYVEFTSINQMRDFMSGRKKKDSVHLSHVMKGCEMRWKSTCFLWFFWLFFSLQTNFLGGELNHEYVPLSISIKTDTIHFPQSRLSILKLTSVSSCVSCTVDLSLQSRKNDMISGLM